ncbi:MAG: putative rane protein, partial [Deltaproteobacteria bacterium]|nr:putative rane protein [Deltaproteobacteria bacterium]
MKRKRIWGIFISAVVLAGFLVTLGLAAYSSHQNDQDVRNFLSVYPFAQFTKLDDCSLCHPGGTSSGKSYGSCDYCHITYGLAPPHGQVPLNPYGQAYKNAGRNESAVRAIEQSDSDGDRYSNLAEIQGLSFPWDPLDYPGLKKAPAVAMNMERILKLTDHSQLLLSNASKSTDNYARYRGVKIKDLLQHVGLRPEATQITVFAPDGFSKTFPIDAPDPQTPSAIQYDVMGPYPFGYYYGGLDFVEYNYYPGYFYDGHIIRDRLYMMLGYLRDGDPLDKGKLVPDPKNPGRLVLEGEGPYRLVLPQKIAGGPDRPSTAPRVGDGWDYDPLKDHNAGSSVRSVTAIRVEPLPAETTDFNWTESG